MSESDNLKIAHAWLEAFNRHDVLALVELYAEVCIHTSPKIRTLFPDTGGCLKGKEALKTWWTEANQRTPGLHYKCVALTANAQRVFMEYVRQAPGQADMPVAEVLDIESGKIVASRVYHG